MLPGLFEDAEDVPLVLSLELEFVFVQIPINMRWSFFSSQIQNLGTIRQQPIKCTAVWTSPIFLLTDWAIANFFAKVKLGKLACLMNG